LNYPEHISDREKLTFSYFTVGGELEYLLNLFPEDDEKYDKHRLFLARAILHNDNQMSRIQWLERKLFEANKARSEALAELQIKKEIIKNMEAGL
jgi:hypothetical protein